MRNQYQKAKEIREEIFQRYRQRLEDLSNQEIEKIKVKKGDYVKLKKFQKP